MAALVHVDVHTRFLLFMYIWKTSLYKKFMFCFHWADACVPLHWCVCTCRFEPSGLDSCSQLTCCFCTVWMYTSLLCTWLFFVLVCVWGFEVARKWIYGDLWAHVVLVLILQIFSRINELESALGVYINGYPPLQFNLELKMACVIMCTRMAFFRI